MSTATSTTTLEKPRLRGVFHQWASVAALGAGASLVAMAHTVRGGFATGAFALSLVALFAVSATYHRVHWSQRARAWMRRADHAAIFLLIAGTYTPIAMLGLPRSVGNTVLVWIWITALVGVLQSVFWVSAPKPVTALVAVAAGWTIVPYFGQVRRALPHSTFVLILAGGVVYTLGALAYATRKPDLRPGVLGYHEVFHALTIVAAGLHFAAVVELARMQ